MIQFHLDARSRLPPSQQLVKQVMDALRLGRLRQGDQLPTVREVVSTLAINPNTVLKAYRELEHSGLVGARPGQGTFVRGTLPSPSPAEQQALRRSLLRWLRAASAAGLDHDGILALVGSVLREAEAEGVA
jgi:GntR family transcriptional regulator